MDDTFIYSDDGKKIIYLINKTITLYTLPDEWENSGLLDLSVIMKQKSVNIPMAQYFRGQQKTPPCLYPRNSDTDGRRSLQELREPENSLYRQRSESPGEKHLLWVQTAEERIPSKAFDSNRTLRLLRVQQPGVHQHS